MHQFTAARFAPNKVPARFSAWALGQDLPTSAQPLSSMVKGDPNLLSWQRIVHRIGEVISDEFTARKGEAFECLRQVHRSGKQQRETERCESL